MTSSRALALAIVLSACGRIGFDQVVDDGSAVDTAPDPDLVAWYRVDTGSITLDSTSNANHGSCGASTCPSSVSSPRGGAVRFDGVDDTVTIPDHPALHTTQAFTIAFWVRRDVATQPERYAHFATKVKGTTTSNSWEIYLADNTLDGVADVLGFGMSITATYAEVSTAAPAAGQWTHVAATWGGGTMQLFVDATVVDMAPAADAVFDAANAYLGVDQDNGVFVSHFNGSLDDVRIYRRALSASELAVLAR